MAKHIRLHRTEYKGLPNPASPVGSVTLLTCLLTWVVFPHSICGPLLTGGPWVLVGCMVGHDHVVLNQIHDGEYFWKLILIQV